MSVTSVSRPVFIIFCYCDKWMDESPAAETILKYLPKQNVMVSRYCTYDATFIAVNGHKLENWQHGRGFRMA